MVDVTPRNELRPCSRLTLSRDLREHDGLSNGPIIRPSRRVAVELLDGSAVMRNPTRGRGDRLLATLMPASPDIAGRLAGHYATRIRLAALPEVKAVAARVPRGKGEVAKPWDIERWTGLSRN